MKTIITATAVALLVLFIACSGEPAFIKTSGGMEYKIIRLNDGDPPLQGEYLKLQVKQAYNDSVLYDTRNGMPQYQVFDSTEMSAQALEIFSRVSVGDSVVFRVISDSAFKTSKPPFVKQRGWLYTYVKVLAILKNEAQLKTDMDLEKGEIKN